ncbi:hypothetical protein CTAYLR_003517 [Chrysophaeum taylorii]|uniref:dihydroorotase n=1 Tax=Chrysophaeum taylorii TaxID=2483200 RepID=A0AAD7UCX6_9STRA|nr:hypothetical protein CTAYLR_003517 [Chrysophaeum taylorii]
MLRLTSPDDWHHHLRDGTALETTVRMCAKQFKRAIIMPNLRPPVTTVARALAYKKRILAHAPVGFEPLMTLYLTDATTPQEIRNAKAAGIVACKLYPAGATTNSENGVTDVCRMGPVFREMADSGVLLLIHGEVTDGDIFDREATFIERTLRPLVAEFETLKIVLEHCTTRQAVDFVRSQPPEVQIGATITAHHLLYNRNALFKGGICPHMYCLPILKAEHHRLALVEAATSGNPRFFLGTDSAPHERGTKEAACGCAGVFTAHAALELYAEAFGPDNLDKLEPFASFHGADFYGLPRNTTTVTLEPRPWRVPKAYPYADGGSLVPLRANQDLRGLYSAPSPIQAAAIPVVRRGGDVAIHAETGSGKTLAYLVPLVASEGPAIVLAPSRLLSRQIAACWGSLAGATPSTNIWDVGSRRPVVVTPKDVLEATKEKRFEAKCRLVLDEADALLKKPQGEKAARALASRATQIVAASATVGRPLRRVLDGVRAERGTRPASMIAVVRDVEAGGDHHRAVTAPATLTHVVCSYDVELDPTAEAMGALDVALEACREKPHVLVAVENNMLDDAMAFLRDTGRTPVSIRDRLVAGETAPLVVAEARALRGIDLPELDAVLILGKPESPDAYLHVAGRASRAKRRGLALTLAPGRQADVLCSWGTQLDLRFARCALRDLVAEVNTTRDE